MSSNGRFDWGVALFVFIVASESAGNCSSRRRLGWVTSDPFFADGPRGPPDKVGPKTPFRSSTPIPRGRSPGFSDFGSTTNAGQALHIQDEVALANETRRLRSLLAGGQAPCTAASVESPEFEDGRRRAFENDAMAKRDKLILESYGQGTAFWRPGTTCPSRNY